MEELFYIIPIVLLVFRLISEFLKKYLSPPSQMPSPPHSSSVKKVPSPVIQNYKDNIQDIIKEVQDIRDLSQEDYQPKPTKKTSYTQETKPRYTPPHISSLNVQELRDTLATPQDLRKAFIIGEILQPKYDM